MYSIASPSERRPARVSAQSETRPRNRQGSAEASRSSSGNRSERQPVNSRMGREICGMFPVAERRRRAGDGFDVYDLRIAPVTGLLSEKGMPQLARILQ